MPSIERSQPRVERVDDIPVIYGQLEKMGIQGIVDNAVKPHGNWQGLSHGWVITIWLVHILSEQSHIMEPVQIWVRRHQFILEKLTGLPVNELDLADDRLAACLRELSQNKVWHEIEEKLGLRLIRVYDLKTETMRMDATVGTVYHNPEESSLFQVGKAKNGLYETQFKMMMASLDPMGLGLAVDVEAGNRADDPLYVPCYKRAKAILDRDGILVVGDSKMSAIATREVIQDGADFYLVPLADKKDEPELMQQLLDEWLTTGAESTAIFLPEELPTDGSAPDPTLAIANAFEVTRPQSGVVDSKEVTWSERLLVVRSYSYMHSILAGLQRRLDKAEAALVALTPTRGRGKKQMTNAVELFAALEQIEKKYRVKGLFDYECQLEVEERAVRAYKGNPARVERHERYLLSVRRNHDAITAAEFAAGWRIYATNASPEHLSLTKAVLTYREQIVQENVFRRLHGKVLSITPLYVQRDDHARGLLRLLTVGARFLALGDYVAREALALTAAELAGVYPGNPSRSTPRPTTERMLKAFEGINLIIFPHAEHPEQKVQDVPAVQRLHPKLRPHVSTILTDWLPVHDRILEILGLRPSLFSCLHSA